MGFATYFRFVNVFWLRLLLSSYFGQTLKGELSLQFILTFYNFILEERPAAVDVDSFDKR